MQIKLVCLSISLPGAFDKDCYGGGVCKERAEEYAFFLNACFCEFLLLEMMMMVAKVAVCCSVISSN